MLTLENKKTIALETLTAVVDALKSLPHFYLDELLPGKAASNKLMRIEDQLFKLQVAVNGAKTEKKES